MKKGCCALGLCVLLCITAFFSGCETAAETLTVFDQALLKDCTLTIHSIDPSAYWRYLPKIRELADEKTKNTLHVTVSGDQLIQNEDFVALILQLNEAELPQVEPSLWKYPLDMRPTIYYALFQSDGEKLFDVAIGFGNLSQDPDDGAVFENGKLVLSSTLLDSVYFNGEKIPSNKLFFTAVRPYLHKYLLPGRFPDDSES